ncbi:MAG: BamA/TamA family outer membrane protein [Candidatus Latescibacterota bacterium]
MGYGKDVQGMFALVIAALLSGCFHVGELSQARHGIERQLPGARFEREFELTLGPVSLWMAGLVGALVPGSRQERAVLSEIDRVRVAVYRVHGLPSLEGLELPEPLAGMLEDEGWEVMVKARERDEVMWVLYRACGGAVSDLYVVGLEDGELVLARLEGRLDRLVARAAQMQPELISACLRGPERWEEVAPGEAASASHGCEDAIPDGSAAWPSPMPDGYWQSDPELPWARYNRVDGTYLAWTRPTSRRRGPDWYGELGYAFGGRHWRYRVGAEVHSSAWRFAGLPAGIQRHRVSVGLEYHGLTDTQDDWLISEPENSLAALLLGQDLRDYYGREGWSGYAGYHLGSAVHVTGRLLQDEFSSLENAADWHLVHGGPARERFRPNPAVDEMRVHALRGEVQFDTRDSPSHAQRGWWALATAEGAGGPLGGDGGFQRYLAEVRRYQPFAPGVRLDLRLRAGTARGTLPSQHRYALGGFSSLRGYRYKEFAGDRMALVNLECWVDLDRHWPDAPVPGGSLAGAFLDAGSAWLAGPGEAIMPRPGAAPALRRGRVKASVGWALHLGSLRLFLARPLHGEDEWVPSFRLSRSF